jgi:hypothetical protein
MGSPQVGHSFQETKKVLPKDKIVISITLLYPGPPKNSFPSIGALKRAIFSLLTIPFPSCHKNIVLILKMDQVLTPLPLLWI